MTIEFWQLVEAAKTSGSSSVPTVKLTRMRSGSSSMRPAARSWSKSSRRERVARVTTTQRGSNVRPMTFSPPTTERAHCSLRLRNVKAFSGAGRAHSGSSESTKKDTSERELLVVLNDAANGSAMKGHDLLEK